MICDWIIITLWFLQIKYWFATICFKPFWPFQISEIYNYYQYPSSIVSVTFLKWKCYMFMPNMSCRYHHGWCQRLYWYFDISRYFKKHPPYVELSYSLWFATRILTQIIWLDIGQRKPLLSLITWLQYLIYVFLQCYSNKELRIKKILFIFFNLLFFYSLQNKANIIILAFQMIPA